MAYSIKLLAFLTTSRLVSERVSALESEIRGKVSPKRALAILLEARKLDLQCKLNMLTLLDFSCAHCSKRYEVHGCERA